MKNYCFTISSDDVKWKDKLLRAAQVMKKEHLTGFKNVLTPAKYYSTICNNFIEIDGKKENRLITD